LKNYTAITSKIKKNGKKVKVKGKGIKIFADFTSFTSKIKKNIKKNVKIKPKKQNIDNFKHKIAKS
jgi:hypothetical protein